MLVPKILTTTLLTVSTCFLLSYAKAQTLEEQGQCATSPRKKKLANADAKTYASPSVTGMQRGKGVSMEVESLSRYAIICQTDSSLGIHNSQDVSRNSRFEFKTRIPLINKPGLKMVMGLKYSSEEYQFNASSVNQNEFYKKINDKNFRSLGTGITLLKSFNEKNFFSLNLGVESNGRYANINEPQSNYFRYVGTALYGWKISPNLTYGLGVSYAQSPGITNISPILVYYQTFNTKWGLEAALPSKLRMRYNASSRMLLYGGLESRSSTYYVRFTESQLSHYGTLALRKTEVRMKLEAECKIHNWLWMNVNAGLRENINFRLSDPSASQRMAVVRPKVKEAVFIGFGVFMVAPEKFLK